MDKIEFRIAFGKRVEEFRKKLGLSYRELAQKCDVDYSNISKIEKGEVEYKNFYDTGIGERLGSSSERIV